MKEELEQYVNLLFAGLSGVEDVKQEILQNTMDRYDDLIAQGRTPEAAYRLAIAGIGDLDDILQGFNPMPVVYAEPQEIPSDDGMFSVQRLARIIAIGLYIISPIPIILLSAFHLDEIGVVGTLIIVAIATMLLMLFKKPDKKDDKKITYDQSAPERDYSDPGKKLKKSIGSLFSAICLAIYFLVSFATGKWYITWVIFPIAAAAKGLVNAIIDVVEVNR